MAEENVEPTEPWIDPEQAILKQDSFRKVYLGEISDPLFPPHPGSPETPEDELTQAALADTGAAEVHGSLAQPTVWRLVTLLAFAVFALAIVFWKVR